MKIFAYLCSAFLFATPAFAQSVSLHSEVFVEKVMEVDGEQKIVRIAPETVVPGDKLVFVVHYHNDSEMVVEDFVLNNPLPEAVTYAGIEGKPALVSIDDGETFGELSTLKVIDADGNERAATAADVTNLRWDFDRDIAVDEQGKLTFLAFVK